MTRASRTKPASKGGAKPARIQFRQGKVRPAPGSMLKVVKKRKRQWPSVKL